MGTRQAHSLMRMCLDVSSRDRSTCWTDGPWSHDADGYGILQVGKRAYKRANRFALALAEGAEKEDLHALHSCHTPACYNPAHLRWGTNADNIRDRELAGRTARGKRTMNGWNEKLDEGKVREARRRYASGASIASLCGEYRVTDATMGKAIHGKTWKWVD